MLLRGMTEFGCLTCQAPPGFSAGAAISASVGQGGANRRPDVLTIQRLLNGVRPADGGPSPLLIEDGLVGPLTQAAILRFQTLENVRGRTGGAVRDDRIDPDGPTLRRLNEISRTSQRTAALTEAGEARMRRVASQFEALRGAFRAGLRASDQALGFLTLGAESPFAETAQTHYRRAEFYFRLQGLAPQVSTSVLGFVSTTLRRIVAALDAPIPFGPNIFDNDPVRAHPDWFAYSPMQTGSDRRHDGTTPLRIYLCDRIDQIASDDKFTHILSHELFHFIDDESPATWIVDAPNGYREGALRLSHEQRMRNADNYALFVTHSAIGRARLVASQPTLAPLVPTTLA